MSEKQLYFIAIVPSGPVFAEAQEYKELFAEEYGSKAALKSPPHITLHMPFKLKPVKEENLISVLKEVADECATFDMHIKDFGQFNQRTIFMDIEANEELHGLFKMLMKAMKVNFNIFNADYKNRGYNPHLTVAFRDLKKEAFKRAWPQFEHRKTDHQFEVNDFTLLKHNGKSWDAYEKFKLGGNKKAAS